MWDRNRDGVERALPIESGSCSEIAFYQGIGSKCLESRIVYQLE